MRFVWNLFLSKSCEFYYDDVTVTSVMNITYSDVNVESIPQGRRSVIRFLWAKQLSTKAVQSKMHPV